MFHIYNDWLVEFCKHYPSGTSALACLPTATSTRRSGDLPGRALGCADSSSRAQWDMEPMWTDVGAALQAVTTSTCAALPHVPVASARCRERQTGQTRRAAFFTSVAGLPDNLVLTSWRR